MIVDIRRIGVSAIFAEVTNLTGRFRSCFPAVSAAVSQPFPQPFPQPLRSPLQRAQNLSLMTSRLSTCLRQPGAIAMAGLDQLIMMPP